MLKATLLLIYLFKYCILFSLQTEASLRRFDWNVVSINAFRYFAGGSSLTDGGLKYTLCCHD